MGITRPVILSSVSHETHLDLILIQLSSNDVQGSLVKAENDSKAEVPLPLQYIHTSTTSHFSCCMYFLYNHKFSSFLQPTGSSAILAWVPSKSHRLVHLLQLVLRSEATQIVHKVGLQCHMRGFGCLCKHRRLSITPHGQSFYHGIFQQKSGRLYLRSLMRLVFKGTLAIIIFCCDSGFFCNCKAQEMCSS